MGRGNFKNILVKTVATPPAGYCTNTMGLLKSISMDDLMSWMGSDYQYWFASQDVYEFALTLQVMSEHLSSFLQSPQGPSLSIYTMSLLSHIGITNGVSFLNFAHQPFLDMFSSLSDWVILPPHQLGFQRYLHFWSAPLQK